MGNNWQGRRKEIRGKKKERKEGGRGVGKEEGRERERKNDRKEGHCGRARRTQRGGRFRWQLLCLKLSKKG